MSAGHCVAPPSARARTIQCRAHVRMEQAAVVRNPELAADTAESREGTAAHQVCELRASAGHVSAVGDAMDNGERVTQEMIEGAELWTQTILLDLQPYGLSISECAFEVAVACSRIHPLVWGTPDGRAWISPFSSPHVQRPKLFIWDYKFGFGPIEVFECYQLTDYASGAVAALNLNPGTVIDIELVIVQPRAHHRNGPVRRWRTDSAKLARYWEESALACHEALDDGEEPLLRVGPECEHCYANGECPALERAAANACDTSMHAQPLVLSPQARGVQLRIMKRAQLMLESRISGLEQDVEANIRRGHATPGWMLESGQGREVWVRGDEQIVQMGEAMGIPLRKPVAAITPKQARDAGLPSELTDVYATHKPGAAKLVEVDLTRAKMIFSDD